MSAAVQFSDALEIRGKLEEHNIKHRNVKPGKLPFRPRIFALNSLSATQQPTLTLLHVRDTNLGTYFLVDTGAEVSIVPPTSPDRVKPPSLSLIAANGSHIKLYGTRQMTLRINNNKYTWRFQVADVHKSILGADFLRANNLLVDLTYKRLIRLDSLTIIKGVLKDVPANVCNIIRASHTTNKYAKLLQDRPKLTTPTFALEGTPKHGVRHYIVTNGPPVHALAACPLKNSLCLKTNSRH